MSGGSREQVARARASQLKKAQEKEKNCIDQNHCTALYRKGCAACDLLHAWLVHAVVCVWHVSCTLCVALVGRSASGLTSTRLVAFSNMADNVQQLALLRMMAFPDRDQAQSTAAAQHWQ